MNRCFRIVWSAARAAFVVTHEKARFGGLPGRPGSALVLLAALSGLSVAQAQTLPAGGRIVAGSGSIASQGAVLTVKQDSARLIANWQSFDIGAGATVEFLQPGAGSIALNRVLGQNPTQILGALKANGQVLLINPAGIVFGGSAQVDVGALVASSLKLADADFMADRLHFAGDSSAGAVSNAGSLRGRTVALLAPVVRNSGHIDAQQGSALLAAASEVTLDFGGDGLLSYTLDRGAAQALVENSGEIAADGGQIVLTAAAAREAASLAVVNNTGLLRARTLEGSAGRILLLADMAQGRAQVGGTLDASAPAGGPGGFIETSAAQVTVADGVKVDTSSATRKGLWLIDPTDFTIAASGGDISGATLGASLDGGDVTIVSTQGQTAGNGDILVKDTVGWSGATTLTLSALRNVDFSGGGSLLASATGSGVTLNAQAGAVIAGSAATTPLVQAGTLTVTSATGIGSAAAPLLSQVANAALTSGNGSGASDGIHLVNSGNLNLAASSTAGDIVVQTAEDANISGNLVLTTVGALSGVSTSGSGAVRLSTGAGSVGFGSYTGAAGNGGNAGSLSVMAGNAVSAAGDVELRAGDGGAGGQGVTRSSLGGGGGNGGALSIAAPVSATGDLQLSAGSGGNGGFAGTGGWGRNGGALSINATVQATGSITLAAGNGGNAGAGYAYGQPGSAGDLVINTAVSTPGAALSAAGGAGGTAAAGSDPGTSGVIRGTAVSMTATTDLSIGSDVNPSSGNIVLQAGMASGNTLNLNGHAVSLANTSTDNLTLQGWAISSLGRLSANVLSITTAGDIGSAASPAPTAARRLLLQGANVFASNSGSTTLDASSASGSFMLDVGSGSLTVAGQVSAGATGDALRLAGQTFTNTAGAAALATPNGRWIVWSGAVQDDDFGGLQSGHAAIWGQAYSPADATVSDSGNRFVFANGAPLKVVAADTTKTYGEAATIGDYSLVSVVDGANFGNAFTDQPGTVVTGVTLSGPPAIVSAGAPASARRDGGIDGGPSYAMSTDVTGLSASNGAALSGSSGGLLTINPRPLNGVLSADARSYDGTTVVAHGALAVGTGYVSGDAVGLAGSVSLVSANASPTAALQATDVRLTGTDAINYVAGTLAGSANISPAPLTVTAANASKTYDGLAYSGGNGALYSGLVNNETAAVLGGTLAYAGSAQGAVDVNSYAITPSGLSSGNYSISYADGTLSVNRAPLTVSANGAGKTYDGRSWSGDNGVQYSGFVHGETTAVLSGSLQFGGSAQGAVNAGSYAITPSGLSAANYAISFVDGPLNIDKAALTISANSASKTYDGRAFSGGNGAQYSGFVGGEGVAALGGALGWAGSAQGAVNAGEYAITPTGYSSGNYAISYVSGQLSVAKAALTVSANNAGKTYDGLAYSGGNGLSYAGLQGSDGGASLGGTPVWAGSAQGARNAGSYTLSVSGLSSDNYTISYADGALTIARAPLTVSASSGSKTYDGQPFSGGFGARYSGLVGEDTPAALGGTLGYSGSSQGATNAGSYTITPTGLSSGNYAISYVDGSLAVSPKALLVTARDAEKTYDGHAWSGGNGLDYSGFVAGQGPEVLAGTATFGGSSQGAVAAGPYVLEVSGLSADNYSLSYQPGQLLIKASPVAALPPPVVPALPTAQAPSGPDLGSSSAVAPPVLVLPSALPAPGQPGSTGGGVLGEASAPGMHLIAGADGGLAISAAAISSTQVSSAPDGSSTTLTLAGIGNSGQPSLGDADGPESTAFSKASLMVFQQAADLRSAAQVVGALEISQQGQSLTASPADARSMAAPSIDLAQMRSASTDVALPSGTQVTIRAGVTPQGVLVISAPPAAQGQFSDQALVLLGLAIVAEQLSVQPGNVTAVVVLQPGPVQEDQAR